MNPIQRGLLVVAGLVTVTLASMSDVQAVTIDRGFYQNGGNACTGALPTYEGALRKRPKAIANEGTSRPSSTVPHQPMIVLPTTLDLMFAWPTNRGPAVIDVTCTFVNGDEFYGSTATPVTRTLQPGVLTSMLVPQLHPIPPSHAKRSV